MSLDVSPPAPPPDATEIEETVLDSEPAGEAGAPAQAAPAEAPRAEPVPAADRFGSVDTLRGFALLGILAMNIVSFGWPEPAYDNPMRGGGFEGTDRAVWFFNHLVFEAKMMTIFSMLFGAGLVLMNERAEVKHASLRRTYYRRIFWLMVIGAIHAYLIWIGDILFMYAECGLLLYFFRNKTPRTLIILGVSLMVVVVPIVLGFGAAIDGMKRTTARVDAQVAAGQRPSQFDWWVRELWVDDLQEEFKPSPEQKLKSWNHELAIYRGGYPGIVDHRAFRVLMIQTFGFLFFGLFFVSARMLLGMGLMKLGVFSGQRSRSFYLWMVGLGYGIGFPLMVYDALALIRHEFKGEYMLRGGFFYNAFGSLVVALGHVGLIMLIVQGGAIPWLTRRLAAVGRMALTNYLTHSIVCTTLFYGYGFGLFGQINRTGLAAIVVAIWVFQLWISPIWLKHFRFGPAEWLWRSLTYRKPQSMRVRPVAV